MYFIFMLTILSYSDGQFLQETTLTNTLEEETTYLDTTADETTLEDTVAEQFLTNPDNACSTGGNGYFSRWINTLYWPIVLFPGLIIGMSVALAFFICSCIALVAFAAHLYSQLKNQEPREEKKRKSIPDCYAENYYDSIK